MNPAPPVISSVSNLYCGPFRVLKRQPQLLGERIDGRAAALPGALGFEAQVPDPAAPGRDDAADRPEVSPIGVLLVEPPDDIGSDADEGPQCRCRPDAVLPAVPGSAEDEGDLLEVVHEELLGVLVNVGSAANRDDVHGEQLL